MNDLAVMAKTGAMAGTIPGSFGVIPAYYAPHVCTGGETACIVPFSSKKSGSRDNYWAPG